MLLEPELSIPRCGCPSSCGGKNALFAQDSLPGRSPACGVLPLPPVPDVLTSPGVLEPPEEPEAAASGECPRRWHGGRAGRWRELQQSCSCLFSLPWFPTSFCANPGCLVPIRVPTGAEGGRERGRVWMCVRGGFGGGASWELGGRCLFCCASGWPGTPCPAWSPPELLFQPC